MPRLSFFLAAAALPLSALCTFNATSQLFQLAGGADGANNVKFSWELVNGAAAYNIRQKSASGDFIATTSPGNVGDVYGLTGGSTIFQIEAVDGNNSTVDTSMELNITMAANPGSNLAVYDNMGASTLNDKSKIRTQDGTYYRYITVNDDQGFNHISEQTSKDGYNFEGDRQVLNKDVVCTSGTPSDGNCRLEFVNWAQHPTSGRVIMWAQFESIGYSQYLVAANGEPGNGNLEFAGVSRPFDELVQEVSFFADPDIVAGYLICVTNAGDDLTLYGLTQDWTGVESRVTTIQPGERRRAPAMIKSLGRYYVFSSSEVGEYASVAKYTSAVGPSGLFYPSRNIGNINTFGARSGQIVQIGDTNVMAANIGNSTNNGRQIMLPIATNIGGMASYHFYPQLNYDDDAGVLVPVQNGRIVSVGSPATASTNSEKASLANDGIQDQEENLFESDAVPFWWEVDLSWTHVISQVDVTPRQFLGSETYIQYNVTASNDGQTWTTIIDESGNQATGFRTANASDPGDFRYVRVNVNRVVEARTGADAAWAAGLHEVTVYGDFKRDSSQ
ncbi:hypothetical protein DHEL01_v212552 [Diaporthe helianthi]|uniref:F5/8 type C domain-containing protein n=1 Tax=Diaporthe helianthi TaxID=158607 RepID=A0A2P5HFM8_DIAHE|nr:hypothetical protein DHEL01_v212552 [Diaporthe helianthi]